MLHIGVLPLQVELTNPLSMAGAQRKLVEVVKPPSPEVKEAVSSIGTSEGQKLISSLLIV